MNKRVLSKALAVILAFSFGLSVGGILMVLKVEADNPSDSNKIRICHANPPETAANGYLLQNVDKNATAQGHDDHTMDIIPSYSYEAECPSKGYSKEYCATDTTCTKTDKNGETICAPPTTPAGQYPGKNWDTTGQAIWNNNCVVSVCGNGIKETGEQCDGSAPDHYICTDKCTLEYVPYCGDGQVNQTSEQCDGTAGVPNHYTCTSQCTLEYIPYCGDGKLDEGEQCDDGNNNNGDGCSSTCQLEQTTPITVPPTTEPPTTTTTEPTTTTTEPTTTTTEPTPTTTVPPTGGGGGGGGTITGTVIPTGGVVAGAATSTGPGEVLGASTECNPYLLKYIKLGADNDPEEVKKLESFLNEYLGLDLPLDGVYDQKDYEAVKQFQLLMKDKILAPWVEIGCLPNVDTPTGYVYKTTQWAINNMFCSIPQPDLSDETCHGQIVGLGNQTTEVLGASTSNSTTTSEPTTKPSTSETTVNPTTNPNHSLNWVWYLVGLALVGGGVYLALTKKKV